METAVTPCRLQVVAESSRTVLLRFQLNARGTSLPVSISVEQAVQLIGSLATALNELTPQFAEMASEPDRTAGSS